MTQKPPSITLQNQQGPQRYHQDPMGAGGNANLIKGASGCIQDMHVHGLTDPMYERWQRHNMHDRHIPFSQNLQSHKYHTQSRIHNGHLYRDKSLQTDDVYNDMDAQMPREASDFMLSRQPSVETCSDTYMNDARQKPNDYHKAIHQHLKERHKEIYQLKRDASYLKKLLKELNAQVDEKEQERIAIVNRRIPETIICKAKTREPSKMPNFRAESTSSTEEPSDWKKASNELCRGVGSMTLVLCKIINCTSQSVLKLLYGAEKLAKTTCGAASLDDVEATEPKTNGEEILLVDKSEFNCHNCGKKKCADNSNICTKDLDGMKNTYNHGLFCRNIIQSKNYDYNINHVIKHPRKKFIDNGQDIIGSVNEHYYYYYNRDEPDMFMNYNATRAPRVEHQTQRMPSIKSSSPVSLGNNSAAYARTSVPRMNNVRENIHANGDMCNIITRSRTEAPMGCEDSFGRVTNPLAAPIVNAQRKELPRRTLPTPNVPPIVAPTQRPPPLVAPQHGSQGTPTVLTTGNRVPVTRVETPPAATNEETNSFASEYTLGGADEVTCKSQEELVELVEKEPSVELVKGMYMAKSDSSDSKKASASYADEKLRRKRRSFFHKNKMFLR